MGRIPHPCSDAGCCLRSSRGHRDAVHHLRLHGLRGWWQLLAAVIVFRRWSATVRLHSQGGIQPGMERVVHVLRGRHTCLQHCFKVCFQECSTVENCTNVIAVH